MSVGRRPAPELSPEDVVNAQLAALQRVSAVPGRDLAGVLAVWAFASPGNRAATGPVERFAAMLRGPLYRCLLDFRTAQLAPPVVGLDSAQQDAVLLAADGAVVGVTFMLSRQTEPPYASCWMTDGVLRHP